MYSVTSRNYFPAICNNELGSNLHISSEGHAPMITYSCEQMLHLQSSSNALVCTMIRDLRDCNILKKTESPTAHENNTVCEHPRTVSYFRRCQGSVNWKNLASVNKGSSSAGLFLVPKSLFLNTCSLDKIKNKVQASVALAADFQSWDIDIGVISEMHLCRQKPVSIVAIEGYTTY